MKPQRMKSFVLNGLTGLAFAAAASASIAVLAQAQVASVSTAIRFQAQGASGSASAPAQSVPAAVPAASPAQANSANPPDLARAQQIVTSVCGACHGAEGISVAPANPHLAGQHAHYISRQLDHYKSGLRKNPVMMAMAAQLTPEEQRALGVYFSDKKPKPGSAKDKSLAELGQKIYRGGNARSGLPACASCHAPNGAGIPVQYPRLAGQYSDYVYLQLQGFVNGDRGGEIKTPEGKIVEDTQGKVMTAIASKMSDREMRAVAEYVAGLR